MKNVFINVNFEKSKAIKVLSRFELWALKNKIAIYSLDNFEKYSKKIKSIKKFTLNRRDKKFINESFAVSFGGDGTMLSSARLVSNIGIPLLGINLGSLGFLSTVKEDLMEKKLEMVLKGRYELERCDILEAKEKLNTITAFNDIIMLSKEFQRLIRIKIDVDGKNISTTSADGVVISTPKGSTAYSMSAGGPIVFSDVRCFIITPICPHLLVQRSIVVKSTSEIRLTPPLSDAVISGDSQLKLKINRNESVIIKKYRKSVNLIKFSDIDFIDIMKEKFFLGRDPRL